jgi:phosphoribosylformylglycinamidine synthase I
MKFGIIVFPGSNCDHDCYHVTKHLFKQKTEYIWHKDKDLQGSDCVILPGGFSYGDYLRPGAIAQFSPILKEIISFANRGGLVLGICNGFQILVETGLLPGVLMRNKSLRFICDTVNLRVENNRTPFTTSYEDGDVIKMPIAHNDGNYFVDDETLKRLEDNGQIVFRYAGPGGETTVEYNPNGALKNIAAICNKSGTILGMMPHPERRCESVLGGEEGKGIFESVISNMR